MTLEDIARVCHEANRALCLADGDDSQRLWDEAPLWQRESALAGVEFRAANPDAPDSATHDAWSADKRADGWRHGETKCPVAKTHPCLIPFDQLPPHQRAKDTLFGAICKALLPLAQPPVDNAFVTPGGEQFASPALAPHQQRVLAEHRELVDKHKKLSAFFGTDTFSKLDETEQRRLSAQIGVMEDYAEILAERIAAFTTPVAG